LDSGGAYGYFGIKQETSLQERVMSVLVTHIERKPDVCGGRPCITGTRIRAQDIFSWHDTEGLSPDEIVSRFPQLTLADVYAALAYYWDHRDDIQRQIKADQELIDEMKRANPSRLPRMLNGTEDGDASLPPG
jgi:uncharacterized protein (DUF433 family)